MADSWERFIVNITELRDLYDEILTVREQCAVLARTTRNTAWLTVGREVEQIQTNFARALDDIAKVTAVNAKKMIVAVLHQKTVRPPSGLQPRLQDLIWCTPVSTGPFSFGQVEIAWISKLDQAINPNGGREPYWRSQEFGSSHNVGRGIFGMFDGPGGSSVPSPLEFRQHPIFLPGPGGPGTIKRPIPAKHFLRDGTDAAKAQWLAMVRVATQVAVSQIRALKLP